MTDKILEFKDAIIADCKLGVKHTLVDRYIALEQAANEYGMTFPELKTMADERFNVTIKYEHDDLFCKISNDTRVDIYNNSAAVRATHIPSGVTAYVDTSHSVHRNRHLAIVKILEILNK